MVQKYLVTGASGYIAMHVVDQILKEGHSVRGTIRSLNDKEKVDALKKLGPVELVEANLDDAESWKRAVKGIDIVIHVATPTADLFTMEESVAIKQAVDGTLNVLNAALEEGIKRAVVTSSTVTLYDDQTDKNKTFSESDWGDVNKVTNQFVKKYHKSKIHAEKAAWDFYEKHKKDGFKLVTVLPSFTLGPALSSFNKSSVALISTGFDKKLGFILTMMSPICDVRDVALAHLRAAQLDEAVGHRFIITADDRFHSTTEIFKIIEEAGHELNKNISDPLDKEEFKDSRVDNSIMRTILKVEPTDIKKTTLDMVQSFFDYGIVKK